MISTARSLLYRFGQLSTLAMVAALAMAAAPQALSAVELDAAAENARPIAPPVVARPTPMVRVMTFERPIADRRINSNFGVRHLAGEAHARMHQGVDIAAPTGVPVLSSAQGVVVRTGYDAGGYGNFVEIRHPNGLTTFYGHLSAITSGLASGAEVEGGQQIGRVGSTGYSTGPHLHFEVRRRGARLNPVEYLGRQFVLRGPERA
ncbi:MAG TPA: M23 family metallopeptidase [Brevundimonas sp.]|jgi:murein DD-endopeptidase MepM/ murein hydrolase activator NlpD|uniref:M23 family metallopeptidase n=1 Tax=Brevundimonas sp. TaxID=1871086 RepID=UPI002C7DD3E4|nr:M23 family metallopeptidase [Brevundimonas sp.]HRH19941.1 M23 family metallopeptidase [Brevundimonas sp.]